MKKSVMLMVGIFAVALAGTAQAAPPTMFAVQDSGANDKFTVDATGTVNAAGAATIVGGAFGGQLSKAPGSTPLTKPAVAVLKAWIKEQGGDESHFLFPNPKGGRLSADAVQHAVAKHVVAGQRACPSLAKKRVTPHVLRHAAAMELLQAGVDRAMIAIWLGHESLDSTQIYLDADLQLKEAILAKTNPLQSKPGRYRPDDQLLSYLKGL